MLCKIGEMLRDEKGRSGAPGGHSSHIALKRTLWTNYDLEMNENVFNSLLL